MNEVLATTEYDSIPDDTNKPIASDPEPAATSVPSSNSASDSTSSTSSLGSNAQATYSVDPTIGTETVPSSRIQLQGARRRSLSFLSLSQRAFPWASSHQQHRFVARHRRASNRQITGVKHTRRDSAIGYTPEQSAIAKGYAEGWKAAKVFAAYNGSRLGTYSDDPLNI